MHHLESHVEPYPVRLTTANEAGGSNSRDDSRWNEEAKRERLEAAASAPLNGSDSSGSVGLGFCWLRVRETRPWACALVRGGSEFARVCDCMCRSISLPIKNKKSREGRGLRSGFLSIRFFHFDRVSS